MSKQLNLGQLEYFPLTLYKVHPTDMNDDTFELRNHVGKVKYKATKKSDDIQLPSESLLVKGKANSPLLLYWITMYNEPFTQLVETLAGVYRSYYELVDIDDSFKDRVHILIIVDGYEKLDLDFLISWERAGIYNELKTKRFRAIRIPPGSNKVFHKLKDLNFINKGNMNEGIRVYGTNNVGHCFSRNAKFTDFYNALPKEKAENMKINSYNVFEFTLGSDKQGRVKENKFFHLTMPVHFMIKHRNQGKIDSHKWFFKGFCEYMNPKYAQILDWGSIPLWNSISHIIMHMETKPQVGGAWGEIEVLIPERKENGGEISFWESVLLRAQYIEYKLSHYLDKSTETLFGFVSVLPGAFSTFRWDAIKGAPLKEFLRGSTDEFGDVSHIQRCASANKYLAEDRIMCLEIIAKRNENYIIHYVPGAKWLTDPPLSLNSLIKQRRRWFNGSLFASIHVIKHMWRVWGRGKCSCIRNMAFLVLYFYLLIQMIVFFVIVGIFFAIFSIFIRSALPDGDCVYALSLSGLVESLFIALLFGVLMISITIDIDWSDRSYTVLSFLMGIFMLIMAGCCVVYAINGNSTQIGLYFLIAFMLSYLVPLMLNWRSLKVKDFLKGIVYVTYLSATYVNILTIYAISNIHDVSWGSRATVVHEERLQFEEVNKKKRILYKNFRSNFLVFWLITNIAAGYAILHLTSNEIIDIIMYLGVFLIFITIFKLTFSTLHLCKAKWDRWLVSRTIRKRKSDVFKNIKEENIKNTEQEFVVYFDKRDSEIRFSTKDEADYRHAPIKSAVKDRNTFRGFNLSKINQRHRISQGYYGHSFMKNFSYYEESDTESEEVPLSTDESDLFSRRSLSEHSAQIDYTMTNILNSVNKNEKSEGKTKFDVSSEEIEVIHEESWDDSEAEEWEISDSSDGYTERQRTTSRMHRKSSMFRFNNFTHY